MVIKAHVFERIGLDYINKTPQEVHNIRHFLGVAAEKTLSNERRFRSFYGASSSTCERLWMLIDPYKTMPRGVQPFHLLWGLLFLKVYATEPVHCSIVGCPDEKTFRKWSILFVNAISQLENEIVSVVNIFVCVSYLSFVLMLQCLRAQQTDKAGKSVPWRHIE